MRTAARENRAFLGCAARYPAEGAGITQFLHVGSDLPSVDNIHAVSQEVNPAARAFYVDYDPVVLAHARALLTSGQADATDYIDADLHNTGTILDQAAKLLDFTKPAAVTLIAILHAIPDSDDPHAIVTRLMAPGARHQRDRRVAFVVRAVGRKR